MPGILAPETLAKLAVTNTAKGEAIKIETEVTVTPADLLRTREFNPAIEPPPLRTVYSLNGITIATPGNLVTITSAVKTGKTAVISAIAAAALPHSEAADLLGFESSNPDRKALLWFDSEQSPDDFWHTVKRALTRAGLDHKPEWLHAYCLTGLGCVRALECVMEAVKQAKEKHPGLHSTLLDGVADLILDVNDAGASNGFVATLHKMAIENDCPIIGVIHLNPGSEKSRGHLGSQLERKAETNLMLEKDNSDESTVIYSTKNRRAGIPKNAGPRFRYSIEAGMHVTIPSRRAAKEAEEEETLRALAEDIFQEHRAMRYSDIHTTVKKRLGVSDKTAERKIKRMKQLTVIQKATAGLYEITKPAASI